MSFAPVFRLLGIALFAIALAKLLALGVGWLDGDEGLGAFALGVFLAAFLGCCFFAVGRTAKRVRAARSGFRELVFALTVFWLALPCIAAIPLMGRGYSFADAWFETVSALTTTGAWLSEPAARATASGMLYRVALQWIGGLVALATAAAVFVRPEFIGIDPAIPPFARGKRDSYLRALTIAASTFLPVYLGMTIVGFVLFLIGRVPGFDAAVLALSFVASGGFSPVPGGLETYGPAAVTAGSIMMLASAVNFIVIARLALRGGGRFRSRTDPETRALVALLIPVALIYWFSIGAGPLPSLLPQLGNAVSLLSTSGILFGETPQLTPLLVTAVIGGAAVSTAGGIKLLRWIITFQRAGEELWQLSHPGGVLSRKRALRSEFGVWIHTIAFTIVLAALVLTVAFFGYELELAAAAAVAVVTNAGPLLAAAPGTTADYVLFAEPLRLVLAIGMIAGRLELVLLLLLFDREFWQG